MAGKKVTWREASGRPGPSQQEGVGALLLAGGWCPVWRRGPEDLDAPGRVWGTQGRVGLWDRLHKAETAADRAATEIRKGGEAQGVLSDVSLVQTSAVLPKL